MKKSLCFFVALINISYVAFGMHKKNWIFVVEMPDSKDQEDADKDWRIKDGKLELKADAEDAIISEKFMHKLNLKKTFLKRKS